ncbi:MAG: succinylglutamate desuccinylase [Burkholderiaceae bacterium]
MDFVLPKPDIATWRAGNTGVQGVWQFDSGKPGRHVLISALVHGNELCGAWTLKALLEAQLRPTSGILTLAFCNLAAFDRFDAAAPDASRFVQEDMNRVWSADKLAHGVVHGGTAERMRARELLPFVEQADWLLDLHSMHEPGAPLLLTGLQPRNIELARMLQAPQHIIVDAGHQDGVRLRDYGRFSQPQDNGTRALLIECGYHGDPHSRAVAQDITARFLSASGCVPESALPAHWRLPTPARQRVLRVTGAVAAKSATFSFAQPFKGLEKIQRAGTQIALNNGEPVTTPYDDCVLIMPSLRQLRAGVTVVRFAREAA